MVIKVSRMSKTKIISFITFSLHFSSLCGTTLAKSKKDNENDFLLRNGSKSYVNFCTGFYLMLEQRWEEAIVF